MSKPFPFQENLHFLKSRLTIERVLDHYGLRSRLKQRGHRLIGPCPIHPNADNPRAFVVDLNRQLWHCFTRDHGGDVISLIRSVEGLSYPQTARRLADLAGVLSPTTTAPILTKPFQPYTRRLRLQQADPFFLGMDLHPNILHTFEAGIWPYPFGFLEGCAAVRLHTPDGKPLGYAGRRLHDLSRGKWVLPRAFPKNTFLFNAHRMPRHLPHALLVVEGAWGVMKLAQAGFPVSVALFGLQLSPFQRRWITQLRVPVLVLTDGDDPGREAGPRIAAQLGSLARFLPLPWGRDPEDLSVSQLQDLLQPFLGPFPVSENYSSGGSQ